MPIKDKEKRKEYEKNRYNNFSEEKKKDIFLKQAKEKKEKPWIRILCSVRSRCSGKNHHYYKKGIKNFLTREIIKELWDRDMGWELEKPSIDRINNSKNYEKSNCRIIELAENIKKR